MQINVGYMTKDEQCVASVCARSKRLPPLVVLLIVLMWVLQSCGESYALLNIDINRGYAEPIPIALGKFEYTSSGANPLSKSILSVIKNDLESSGLFRIIDENAFLEEVSFDSYPRFANWRRINANVLVAGKVHFPQDSSVVTVHFKIWDPYKEQQFAAAKLKIDQKSWRRIAHRIADLVYNCITGDGGYFDSRILFVAESGSLHNRTKRLAIMDQDGAAFQYLTDGKDMILNPRFDYRSHRAIYVSYKNQIPQVFLLDIAQGRQQLVGNFPGMSFAPRFSPDGEHIVMSLAKNGTTSIYEFNLHTRDMKKIVGDVGAISTSPSYSPDGLYITFNSDRSGKRQIYVADRDGSNIKRISFNEGVYATPVWSPRGDYIAFTKIYKGRFYIGVMKQDGSGERLLTSSWFEEAPTWAPNGRVIMFYRKDKKGQGKIYAVDITGDNERVIQTKVAAVDPAWSPLLP